MCWRRRGLTYVAMICCLALCLVMLQVSHVNHSAPVPTSASVQKEQKPVQHFQRGHKGSQDLTKLRDATNMREFLQAYHAAKGIRQGSQVTKPPDAMTQSISSVYQAISPTQSVLVLGSLHPDTWNGEIYRGKVIGKFGPTCYTIISGHSIQQSAPVSPDANCELVSYPHDLGSYSHTDGLTQYYAGGSGSCYQGKGRQSSLSVVGGWVFSLKVDEDPACFYRLTLTLTSPRAQHLSFSTFRNDPEGPFLAEVQQLLRTVRTQSMLDYGCSLSGHMFQRFGQQFSRMVVLANNATLLHSLKSMQTHPDADFILGDMISFGRTTSEKFDVIFLNMVLEKLPTYEVSPTIRALEALLTDEGVGIISTTHVEESSGGLYLSHGGVAKEEVFNAAPDISRARRWTKSELTHQLEGRQWEITSHVMFTFYSELYARQAWKQEEQFLNRSFHDVCRSPFAQMVAVRRLVVPYSSKFASPLEPSSANAKNVIFSLIRGGPDRSDYDELIGSRKCLYNELQKDESINQAIIDEVFFHEGNVPDHIQRNIVNELPGSRFVDIRSYGAFGGLGNGSGGSIYRWRPWERLRRHDEYSVGYRHMCRFMAMLWMHVLSKYEYAARIDDDVCIHRMVNPFNFLRTSRADYAYALLTKEHHSETVFTLGPWLDDYIRNHSITPQKELDSGKMYFTNFFVTNVSWWLGDSVRLFLHTVDRSGNIYDHRWGDAPLQTAALQMFAAPPRVQWMRVDYSHMSTLNEVRNGSEVLLEQRHEPKKSIESKLFLDDLFRYVAPCAVADYFKLEGAPFKSHFAAIRALRKVLQPRALTERVNILDYTPGELSYAVQVDLFNSSKPLPTENIRGSARRNALVRLFSGKDREQPERKEFTIDEWTNMTSHSCFTLVTAMRDRLKAATPLVTPLVNFLH